MQPLVTKRASRRQLADSNEAAIDFSMTYQHKTGRQTGGHSGEFGILATQKKDAGMPRYDKPQAPSPESQADADRIARSTQKPGQTKEQTRLIAQGIQKGIEEYKRQQKAKARARDRAKKKVNDSAADAQPANNEPGPESSAGRASVAGWLPWCLLVLSWLFFAGYLTISR